MHISKMPFIPFLRPLVLRQPMGGLSGWPLPLLKPGASRDASRQHGGVGSGGDDGGDGDGGDGGDGDGGGDRGDHDDGGVDDGADYDEVSQSEWS